jgi:DNA-binding HxlR family transcriptional regulator
MCWATDWSLLIIRGLLIHGTRTYSEFLGAGEHISTNILAARVETLSCLELIERTDPEGRCRNNAYQLTAAGAALRPVLEGLGNWAHTHLSGFHADIVSLSCT